MSVFSKLILSSLVVAGTLMVVRHGASALNPAIPKDMPRTAAFVPSGYDLAHNEKKGEWISCSSDTERGTDVCRVTDTHGSVIFQGEFLPVNGSNALSGDQLKLATHGKTNMWVEGPTEESPVPVIPLANGEVLVPSDDAYALAARWSRNPDELQRLYSE